MIDDMLTIKSGMNGPSIKEGIIIAIMKLIYEIFFKLCIITIR